MAYGDKNLVPKVEIEAVQTMTTVKQTDPWQTWRVLATDPVGSGIFRRCLNIVVYYKMVEEDSSWIVVGWIKESLGTVLADQPILSGRLRGTSSEDIGELEIVSNYSGVRLIEAKIPKTLSQFLDHQSKKLVKNLKLSLCFGMMLMTKILSSLHCFIFSLDKESDKKLILARVEEVEREVGSKMASKFPVYLRKSYNKIKIEYCTKNVDHDQQLELIEYS
ncbi:hypothetical protein EZV62_023739 [Acer yangbiense]|uniref:Uncharacterized protein n=1 Tax=Acer yangbiense TaxID=1000413 RepID=A0A5C7H3D3_9ROSI|nr:hypothetical protein EZV62_023739 [Acer yangbiense]